MRKRNPLLKILSAVCLVIFAGNLSGCVKDKAHYEAVQKKALSYYRKKYNDRKVTITESYKAGNSGLFGYVGVKDRAYDLSDGYSVYWNEDKQTYADNRQAEEIAAAFEKEIMGPAIAELGVPVGYSAYYLNRTNMDSYDECVYQTYFDGDLRKFLQEEKPRLSDLIVELEENDSVDIEGKITGFYDTLSSWVKGLATVNVLRKDAGFVPGNTELVYRWIKDPEMAVQAQFVLGNEIQWYCQVYIEVFEGVYVMSDKANLTLSEGDIVFEEVGTCEQLQALLDEAYYSMPVDAEQNKNGGYAVHDQRHEKRVVLDDPSAPLYRLKISDKVQEYMKDDGRLPAYMYTEREDTLPLMIYPGYGNLRINVYKVYGTKDTGTQYESLTVEDLFYFGTHHMEGLDEQKG